jgi:hypothetical protein
VYRRDRGTGLYIPTDELNQLYEIHDVRDSARRLTNRDKELPAKFNAWAMGEGLFPKRVGESVNLGVARLYMKNGRESINKEGIAALRRRYGADIEQYVVTHREPVCLANIDAHAIEDRLKGL